MGRRIPKSRKQNKLKSVDPFSKRHSRKREKGMCNLPPDTLDDQHMPRKLKELMKMQSLAKTKKVKKKKLKHKRDCISVTSDKYEEYQKGMTRPLKYIPDKMKQRQNESEEHFFWRIQQITNHAIAEAQVEAKYDMDIDGKQGKVENSIAGTTKPTQKQLKRKLLEEKKKEKRKKKLEDKIDDYGHLFDEVKFGETVIQPPKLIVPRRAKEQLKAGQKQLMLKAPI